MTPYLLLWLALPQLAVLAIAQPTRRGFAAARLVLIGFGLAALVQGVGTLDPNDLTQYAAAGPGPALFVSLTAGLILGGSLPRPLRDISAWLAGAPLALGLAFTVFRAPHLGGLLLGIVLGGLPASFAVALPAPRPRANMSGGLSPVALVLPTTVVIAVVTGAPLVLVMLLTITAAWAAWLAIGAAPRPWPLLPAMVTLLLLGATWLAVTVAGDVLIPAHHFDEVAPLSAAAGRLMGLMLSVAIVTLMAPWPLHRLMRADAVLPALIAVGYTAVTSISPDGMAAWSPLVTALLVVSLLAAGIRGQESAMLVTVAGLGALHSAVIPLAGTILLGLWMIWPASSSLAQNPLGARAILEGRWWSAAVVGLGAALVTAGVLRDEVVLGTTLAAGVAFVLAWRSHWFVPLAATT